MQVIHLQKYIGTTDVFDIELLISKIIKVMLTNEDIMLRTDEGFSFEENGLFNILDNLCTYWNYDKSRITIETNNWNESHDQYNIKPAEYSVDLLSYHINHNPKPWNQEKVYGMFIGRGSAERIYSVIKNKEFKFNDRGLSSFHYDFDKNPLNSMIAEASIYSKWSVDNIISITPYSDIDKIRITPITPPFNSTKSIWDNVYKKIAVEIVCETNLWPTSFQMTEKTFRPMYYQRPFIVLGSKDYLKKLKNIGFKTFDNVIPLEYDRFERFERVDKIFQILEDLINNNGVNELLEECQIDIMHNYNLLLELSKVHYKKSKQFINYYEF
jgi:hypothetical protein